MPELKATYERPVSATLHVHLDTGESWEVTPEDLEQFRLVRTIDAYLRFRDALFDALRRAGLLESGDLTDAHLNAVRYLAEIAITMPELLNHHDYDEWKNVAAIERTLIANPREADLVREG